MRLCACVVGVFVILGTLSCTRSPESPATGNENVPGQFEVRGRTYILSQKDPGIILDDSVRYMSDGGSRTFDFVHETVNRQLFAGRQDRFDVLGTDERQELLDVANGALTFIHRIEKERSLSALDQSHRQILAAFVRFSRGTR